MHFSNIALVVFAGTVAASSLVLDLNSTELNAVLIGAGPVITEIITTTEHLAVIPTVAPYIYWGHGPVLLSRLGIWPSSRRQSFPWVGNYRASYCHPPSTTPILKATTSQPTTTSTPPKIIDFEESTLQSKNRKRRRIIDLDILATIPLITPSWTVPHKKRHQHRIRSETTAVVISPAERETTGVMDAMSEILPCVTPSAFNA